jgi:hypothetical protein
MGEQNEDEVNIILSFSSYDIRAEIPRLTGRESFPHPALL